MAHHGATGLAALGINKIDHWDGYEAFEKSVRIPDVEERGTLTLSIWDMDRSANPSST